MSRLQSYLQLKINKVCSLKIKTVAMKELFKQCHDKKPQRHEQNQWSVINREYEEHTLLVIAPIICWIIIRSIICLILSKVNSRLGYWLHPLVNTLNEIHATARRCNHSTQAL